MIIEILHQIGIIITALAAVIAAASSLRNGRTLNGHLKPKVDELTTTMKHTDATETEKGAQREDWYRSSKNFKKSC